MNTLVAYLNCYSIDIAWPRLKAKMDNKLISDFVAALEQLSSPELVLKVSNTRTYIHICTHLHMLHTCTLAHSDMIKNDFAYKHEKRKWS